MEAKEMFEELDFEYSNNGSQICYYNENEDEYVWFFLESKTLEVEFDIEMDLLKAINQQCKELGWLDEE